MRGGLVRGRSGRRPPADLLCSWQSQRKQGSGLLAQRAPKRVERRIADALGRLVVQAGRRTPDGIEIDFPITRQDLAEMTGTTLHTVSRTLSEWEAAGLVSSGRQKVVIMRPHALVAIAQDLPEGGGRRHSSAPWGQQHRAEGDKVEPEGA